MRVTVVCNDPLLTEGLESLMARVPGLHVATGDGLIESATTLCRGGLVDAVVVTTDNASKDALDRLETLSADSGLRIVALSSFMREPSRFEREVADVLISRENGLFGLRRAFGLLMRHEPLRMLPNALLERRRKGLQLTRRESDVAKLVAQGKSNRQIADSLGLREQSVKNLVSGIMRKLNCENRVQLALHFTAEPTKIAG